MTIEPDRLADLLARKLVALVRRRWPDVGDEAVGGAFPGGASLVDAARGRAWISLSSASDAERRLGAALAVARRAHADELHVIADDRVAAGVLARRAALFATAPSVWWADGTELRPAVAAPPPVEPAPAPEAELYRPLLLAAGLDAVVEDGTLVGEYLGLEVARVVVDERGAHVEAGVGRFDREAGAMMFADQAETDALARVVQLVAGQRNATAERHPINQLVPERWLRAALVAEPERVGAARLEIVPSAVGRRNLLEVGVASALGEDLDGRPVVVTCSTGIDLDLVPSAADDRLAHAPDARLLLAVPARDAVPVTTELASRLILPATVVAVEDGWMSVPPRKP